MGPPHDTQERLIVKAGRGDRAALQELWRIHRRWVAAIVLAHRPHAAEVEDLMQEVAVKLVSKLDSLRDPASFRPWLRQIVLNVCRGTARGLRPMLHLAQGEPEDGPMPSGQVSVPNATATSCGVLLDRQDAARRLLEQALTLPPEYREPLLLRCIQSLSYQQISELLGLPVTTVETRLARARRMLRAELGGQLGEYQSP